MPGAVGKVKIMRLSTLENIAEQNGFYFIHHQNSYKGGKKNYALFEQYTPLGEDWCIEIDFDTVSELVEKLWEYSDNYDADEEAEIWINCRGRNGVPSSIRDLLDDADWKAETLTAFVNAINERRTA